MSSLGLASAVMQDALSKCIRNFGEFCLHYAWMRVCTNNIQHTKQATALKTTADPL